MKPCKHKGCQCHVSHPCEGCGRQWGNSSNIKPEYFQRHFLGEMVEPRCDVVNREGKHCPNHPVHFIEDDNRRFKLCDPCYDNYMHDVYRIREYLMPPTINPDQLQILAKPKEL